MKLKILVPILALLFAAAVRAAEAPGPAGLRQLLTNAKYSEADAAIKTALAAAPNFADVHCIAGQYDQAVGRYEDALKEFDTAIRLDAKRIEPHGLKAALLEMLGRSDDAAKESDAAIALYNDAEKKTADPRELIGAALALEVARSPREALELLIKAEKANPADTDAAVEAGRLFLGKGQVTDASKQFNSALVHNPKHPAALAGQAAAALYLGDMDKAASFAKSAPNLAEAHNILAAVAQVEEDFPRAEAELAKSLAVNPNDLEAHALIAAGHTLRGNDDACRKEEAAVAKINPRCAEFYLTVGDAYERKRRMAPAKAMFEKAIALEPKADAAMSALGMLLFREGDYARAKELLDRSHALNGYDARTYNALVLLDQMDSYQTVDAGPAGKIRVKADPDGILTPYVKDELASLQPLWAKYGVAPQPVIIEIFPTQRYFSARVVGLPDFGAIGVCFGGVVALTSPSEQHGSINWRETLRHEFTHAVTLTGTDGRIPHWLTEGMAVYEQRLAAPQPYDWDVLLKTFARAHKLIPLGGLTKGFTRPDSPAERMLAYCEAGIAVRMIVEKYGEKCLPRLIKGLRDGKEFDAVCRDVFGVTLDELNRQFMDRLTQMAAELPVVPAIMRAMPAAAILDAAEKNPKDPDALCNLAQLYGLQREIKQAVEAADRAIAADPKCAEAHFLKATFSKDKPLARQEAEAAVRANPNYVPALFLLCDLAAPEKKIETAALLRNAIKAQPNCSEAYERLALLLNGDPKAVASVKEEWIKNVPDALEPCMELARYYREQKQWNDAAHAADKAIGIGPFLSEPHILAGEALLELGRDDAAIREMETAEQAGAAEIDAMELECKRQQKAGKKEAAARIEKELNSARHTLGQNALRLADAYTKQGRDEDVWKMIRRAEQLDPNDEEVRRRALPLHEEEAPPPKGLH